MGRIDRLGSTTYYASRCGVVFDGSDQSASLQAILNRAQSGPIKVIIDGSFKAKALKLYSGTIIEGLPGVVISQATATSYLDGHIFQNANWVSPYNGGTITDHDIVIRDLEFDGNSRNGVTGAGGSMNTTSDGATLSPIRLWGVSRFRIENIYSYDPAGFSTHVANAFSGTIRNIAVEVLGVSSGLPSAHAGTDPVHMNGPATDITIDHISGNNGDDFIAINAIDGHMIPGYSWIWPVLYYGSISRVTVRSVYPSETLNILRLMSGEPEGGGTPAVIDQVTVEDVLGNTNGGTFVASGFGTLINPVLGRVTLRNWSLGFLSPVTASAGAVNTLAGTVGSFTMDGFRLGNRQATNTASLKLDSGASIGRVAILDWEQREDSGEAATTQAPITITQGTIDELLISNANFSRDASTATSFVSATGGTINRLELTGVSCNNIDHVVNVAGGTVSGIVTSHLLHRGAGGNASINRSSGTLSRLIAGALDTALLAAGTIATKHTDGTEDA